MSRKLLTSGALAALALGASAFMHFRTPEAPIRTSAHRERAPSVEKAPSALAPTSEPLVTRHTVPMPPAPRALAEAPLEPEPQASDQAALLGGNLQAAFDGEPAQDRAAIDRTRDMRALIDTDEFRKNGSRVVSLTCTKNICRGELESKSAEADMRSTEAAFLSAEFAKKFPMAIAVPERTKDASGRVRSLFYVYDPRVLEGVPN